jgi:hypothetical protein
MEQCLAAPAWVANAETRSGDRPGETAAGRMRREHASSVDRLAHFDR